MIGRRPKTTKATEPTPVESLKHADKRRNIPTSQQSHLVDEGDGSVPKLLYPRDPSLDPQLVWRGKDDQDSHDLAVPAVPVYIQEKIDPRAIVENLRDTAKPGAPELELTLFDDFDGFEGLDALDLVDFYRHEGNWSNRLILGDALVVMTSLAEKEDLRGKVQMIYLDPPYGIRFGSNWQVSTRKREVSDGKVDHVTRQPEQIRAFRDTWELGIHSYLTYLRDRLVVARDLLTETGSVFVQIGDENVHRVRAVLDEVFGDQNFVSLITYSKTTGATSDLLPGTADYIVWYAKDRDVVKYRRLYSEKAAGGAGASKYDQVELPGGSRGPVSQILREHGGDLPSGSRLYSLDNLTSQSQGREKGEGAASWFPVVLDGRDFRPNLQSRWKTNESGMERLLAARRVQVMGNSLRYVRFLEDFPAFPISNTWMDIGGIQSRSDPKVYVVQTATTAVQRCLLMTTDPGDLVLDPTCGSGTTAYVAEQWGRRWVTIDTSRVAVALARTRLMSARLPYYLLADSGQGATKEAEITGVRAPGGPYGEDVRKGFVYKRVPHVTLKSIAQNPHICKGMTQAEIDAAITRHPESEVLVDQPYVDNRRVRVSGRFTVESLSPHRMLDDGGGEHEVLADPQGVQFETTILDNLRKAGVQNTFKGERLVFARLEPFAGGQWLHAEGDYTDADGITRRVAVSIGPEFGTVGPEQVAAAAMEASRGVPFDVLLVTGFAFDATAWTKAKEINPDVAERSLGRLRVLLVRANPDLAMGDELLKKTGAGNLFTVFGEPDLRISATNGHVQVEIRGLDVYDPTTGEVRSASTEDIAAWFIDSNYDGTSFFVRHAYFTGGQKPYESLQKALRAEIDEAAWSSLYSTTSRPFPVPATGKIATKVINHYGDEVMQVYLVEGDAARAK